MKSEKEYFSMFKRAGRGWDSDIIEIKIYRNHHKQMKMEVNDSTGLSFFKIENAGNLFDLFLTFASLDYVSVDHLLSLGMTKNL